MADKIIAASLTLDSNQANQSLGSVKKQLKEAQAEVIALSEKYGATSKQAIDAAKRAAELKDQIADSKTLVDAFNPDKKFNAFAGALQTVTGGFAAVQGAMGLLGIESDDLQKQLLKVQSAMAFSQGLNSIGDSIASVKTLGQQLVANLGKGGLLGIAVAGVGLLVASMTGLFGKAKELSESQKALNDTLKDYKSAAAEAIQKVSEVRTSFELARKGVISKKEALKTYNDTLGDAFGRTNDLVKAEKNLADKADAYIKMTALKAQANALFAISAQKMAEATLLTVNIDKKVADARTGLLKGFSTDDLKKSIEAQKKELEDGAKEIEKAGIDLEKKAIEAAKGAGISRGTPEKAASGSKKEIKEDPRIQAEKQAAIELEKIKRENFLISIANDNERKQKQIELEFDDEKKRIEALTISAKTKEDLLIQKEIEKNEKLLALSRSFADEQLKIEKQSLADNVEILDQLTAEKGAKAQKEIDDFFTKKKSQDELKELLDEEEATDYQTKLDKEDKRFKNELAIANGNQELIEQITKDHEKRLTEIKRQENLARLQIVSGALDKAAEIVGRATIAGKILGVASATINTFVGATQALNSKVALPEPFATAVRLTNAAAIVASGLKSIKEITKVQVPGHGSGGGSVPSISTANVSAPLQPQAPQVQTTALDANTLGKLGDATIRAYVIENDVTTNQEKIKRLNRASRLG